MQSKAPSKITEKREKRRTVNSPCIGLCNIDFDQTNICKGCGRSIEEITNWSSYTNESKTQVKEKAMARINEIKFDR
jgi:predicted Fe-S protein YdhL (DUF1289 family)|tara:strand:- start:1356 stop:1586 length:231 start_codon:yes stop_codon:yes gene_type:complete